MLDARVAQLHAHAATARAKAARLEAILRSGGNSSSQSSDQTLGHAAAQSADQPNAQTEPGAAGPTPPPVTVDGAAVPAAAGPAAAAAATTTAEAAEEEEAAAEMVLMGVDWDVRWVAFQVAVLLASLMVPAQPAGPGLGPGGERHVEPHLRRRAAQASLLRRYAAAAAIQTKVGQPGDQPIDQPHAVVLSELQASLLSPRPLPPPASSEGDGDGGGGGANGQSGGGVELGRARSSESSLHWTQSIASMHLVQGTKFSGRTCVLAQLALAATQLAAHPAGHPAHHPAAQTAGQIAGQTREDAASTSTPTPSTSGQLNHAVPHGVDPDWAWSDPGLVPVYFFRSSESPQEVGLPLPAGAD